MKQKEFNVITFLNMGIFPGTVMFANGFSIDEILIELKKQKGAKDWRDGIILNRSNFEGSNFVAVRTDIQNKKTKAVKALFYIVLNKNFDFSDYHYCVLAHEVLHICQFFLPDILSRDREFEAEAYLHTHLMQQCLNAVRGKAK